MAHPPATVKVSREGRGSSRSRAWRILIDGSVVASIFQQETVELAVEPGPHGLVVSSMRYLQSPEESFLAVDGQIVGFSCHARLGGPFLVRRWILGLLVSLVKHDLWIGLKPDEPRQEPDLDAAAHRQASAAPRSRVPAEAAAKEAGLPDTRVELALVVNRLSKRFGERTAFSEVSFQVAYGEVFGFLGPNGAGKTTMVRTLGTLIAATSGSAAVAGIPLRLENGVAIRQLVSIMPESPGLYLRLTVTENLEYFAGLYGLSRAGSRIKEALDAVNLGDRAGDLCGGLSKGLRQRVGLARTLLSDPKIMFLDEPTSGLDPVAALEVHSLITGLREKGVTIFLTTHRLEEAEKLCDRVAILNTTLRTVGRPAELREQLFKGALVVRTVAPLSNPEQLFANIPAVEAWSTETAGSYLLAVSDPRVAAPEVTRRLVGAGADVLSISEARHSLEDVYLELVNEDVEARRH